jgi:hypothetical protein
MKSGVASTTLRWVVISLAVGIGASVTASESSAQRLDVGLKGGLSVANLTGEDVDQYDPQTLSAFTGGGFLTLRFTEAFAIQSEVSLLRKGAKIVFDDEVLDMAGEIRVDYIEVPLFLKLSTPPQGARSLVLAALAGPVLSFNSDCEIEASANGVSEKSKCDDMDVPIRSTEWGVAFGAGLGFPVGPGNIWLDGRYALGLTTIDDSDEEDDVRNYHFAVTAGYSLPLWNGRRTLAAVRR